MTPKYCRKGMGLALFQSSSVYLVLDPAPNSARSGGLDYPHLCDTITDGGGWIVIQRRVKGDTDFNRNWAAYKRGFGSYEGDFWLGNEKIHSITSSGGTYELRVELTYQGKGAFAHYDDFFVSHESDNYRLNVGQYEGTAGDSLSYHSRQNFTTFDRDNDAHPQNCVLLNGGGWWYKDCDESDLNGHWGMDTDKGVEWTALAGDNSVSTSEMKIRRL